jgi:hypothetical protein
VILVDASGASATLIEKLTRGDREKLSLPWVKSQDWKDWTEQLKQPVLHRQLHQFLMRHEHNLDDIGLLQATSKVKAQATVDHNSDIADAGETYGIVFKTAKGEDLIKFPKTIAIRLPVLENDVDESTTVAASIKVEVMMPTNPTEQIRFQLYCSEWDSIFRKRIAQERENIQKQLDGWLVGSGTLAYTDRNLPE